MYSFGEIFTIVSETGLVVIMLHFIDIQVMDNYEMGKLENVISLLRNSYYICVLLYYVMGFISYCNAISESISFDICKY